MKIDFTKISLPQPSTEFEQKVISFLEDWNAPSPTVKVQTSGSTGIPKVFEIEKERMRNSARMTANFLNLEKGNSALLCLPIEYISGKMMVIRALERKLILKVVSPTVTPLSALNEVIDFCAMSPLQVENSTDKIHLIKNLIIGGAAVSDSLKVKIKHSLVKNSFANQVYETYGMSETLSHIALKQIFPQPDDYFKTLENIEISRDDRGCLQISAPLLNPEILQTNDLVEIKSQNEFKFLGRIDNVINSGGIKIFPEEMESLVKKHISREVVFLGKKDEKLGQKLIVALEGEPDNELEKLILSLEYPTKNHKPKEIHFVKYFPRTPNGKVNRRDLLNLL